ncbi:LysR family transcriptional regulator [Ramlibacter sp. AW1]|uniref:LysR family transcriptional regulator n=1 Tax=Ramlibacter aurantiacus TaxID=2801330 RepID=A0A937D7D2_9BURK|nr:LysR substrate-binding domain-containing protein [Ramlibacter aurantiacus]MBL0421898.1 LysR family transcriptional regulator [Ramlibacter aurantiacus]
MIELRHLRYFMAVAEELHFSRAALRLNMSQPPLSQQIRQLEEEIGAQLFVRNKRSVTLTNAGRDMYEHLSPWIDELSEIFARTRLISEGERGSLSVGCSYTTSHRLVPEVVRIFAERYPTVTIKLLEQPFARQVEALIRGFVDVAIIRLPVSHSELVSRELYEESLVAVLPHKHRLAGKSKLRLRDLKDEVFLTPSRHPAGLFDSVQTICEHVGGFKPTVLDISSSANSAVALAGAGMGVTLVPDAVRHADHKTVVYKTLVDSPRSMVGVVWRRANASPVTQLFVDVATEVAAVSPIG